MNDDANRRPLASRGTRWAAALTRALARTAITPNQISIASVLAAAVSGAAFWASGETDGGLRIVCLIAAAAFCQLRLLCNLLDGMVAVEAGRKSADGGFWNEMPDRVADILILAGVGYGAGDPALGWAAAGLAVLTAYVRELGRAEGAPVDYCGPMAKPHRMALVTLAALVAIAEPFWADPVSAPPITVLGIALWLLLAGTVVTVARRSARILRHLRR